MNKEQLYQWVKASDELPDKCGLDNPVVIKGKVTDKGYFDDTPFVTNGFRNFDKENPQMYFVVGGRSFLTNNVEWLKPITAVVMSVEEWESIVHEKEAWSLRHVLYKLIESAEILLNKKDYDGHGWEEIRHAKSKAAFILSQLNKIL